MSEHPNQRKHGGSRVAPKPQKKVTPRQKKREKQIMVVMIVLAVIMVIAAAVAVLYTRWVQKPELPSTSENPSPGISQPADPNATESMGPGEEVSKEPEYDPVQPKVSGERKSEDFYSILVFGTDESSNLTDTMMVVSYDVTNQKATAMSIPRDTLINTKASSLDAMKMNCVYSRKGGGEKGIQALMNEASELVGFSIDYYVVVNWELVGLMVDAIDGVYFDIPWDMWYSDPYQDLYIDLKAGYQLLDGDQAMQLVRWRKNMDPETFEVLKEHSVGDIGRLEIQQSFLKSVLKQTLQLKNATKVSELAKLFGEHVVSNLTIENLFWFGTQAIFNGLNVDDVQFVTMPFYYGEYPVQSGDGWKMRSFVYPARKNLLALINESLNPFVDEVTLRELDLVYVNSGGGLSTTSGNLADSAKATLPEEYLLWKELQENPDAASNPEETGDPNVSNGDLDPETSGDPGAADNPWGDSEIPDWLKPSDAPNTGSDPGVSSDPNTAPTDPVWSSGGEPDTAVTPTPGPENTGEPDPSGPPTHPGYYTDTQPSGDPENTGEPNA